MAYEGGIRDFPESQDSRDALLEKAKAMNWYHTIDLGEYRTPGYFDLDRYRDYTLLPNSMEGMRCLDVGTSNGYWCFEMERRGAKDVTAIDIDEKTHSELQFTDEHRKTGQSDRNVAEEGTLNACFRVAASLKESSSVFRVCDVTKLSPELAGMFDVVFCGSMLMHVPSPLVAVSNMIRVAKEAFIINTQTVLRYASESLAEYHGHDYPYVFFSFTPQCLRNVLKASGGKHIFQGPTYSMEYCESEKYTEPVIHTSFLVFKDSEYIDRYIKTSDENAPFAVEWFSEGIPEEMRPNQTRHLVLRAKNTGENAWFSKAGQSFQLDIEVRRKVGPVIGKWHSLKPAYSCPDYLPAGLDTLVPVQFDAPDKAGTYEFRIEMFDQETPFDSATNQFSIQVI